MRKRKEKKIKEKGGEGKEGRMRPETSKKCHRW
jgi:hypothetical protein